MNDAGTAGLEAIVNRAIAGEFDAQDWEADAWAKSEDGQKTFGELLKGL